MSFLPGGLSNSANPPADPPKPVDAEEVEKLVKAFLQKLFIELRKNKRFTVTAFCKKYKISRATLYKVEAGETTYYSEKFLTIMILEGITLDIEKIYLEVILGGRKP